MTVGYMREASTAGVFTFLRLLFYWKGSVWKIVGYEYSFWLWAYMTISICYRFALKGTSFGGHFELFVIYCDSYVSAARSSLTFVLGFYVSIVASRWWNIFMRLPWPDTLCLYIAALIRTRGDRYKKEELIQRRTIVRYLVLSYVMVFRNISERIRKRFPDLDYLHGSLLTSQELDLIKKVEKSEKTCCYWLPLMWIMKMFKRCYEEYRTLDEVHFVTLNQELRKYRDCLNDLLSYDWICTPLVYTQVVNLATAFYMMILMISSQYLGLTRDECLKHGLNDPTQIIKYRADYVIPLFASLQFLFYLGWLKVAQVTLNPFGTDDDDFEVDFLIERNLKMGYAMIDEVHDSIPDLVEVKLTNNLPHTKASAKNARKINPMIGSVANLSVNRRDAQIVPLQEMFEKKSPFFKLSNFMPRMEEKELDGKGLLDKLPSTAPNSSDMNMKLSQQSEQKMKHSEVLAEQVTQTPSQHQETQNQVDARLQAAAAILLKEQQKQTEHKSNQDDTKFKEVTAQNSTVLKPIPGTPKHAITRANTPKRRSSERSRDHNKSNERAQIKNIITNKVVQSPKNKKEEVTMDKILVSAKTKDTILTDPVNVGILKGSKREHNKESKKDKEKKEEKKEEVKKEEKKEEVKKEEKKEEIKKDEKKNDTKKEEKKEVKKDDLKKEEKEDVKDKKEEKVEVKDKKEEKKDDTKERKDDTKVEDEKKPKESTVGYKSATERTQETKPISRPNSRKES